MKRKLDKVFSLPTSRGAKVYSARCRKKHKKSLWQYLYSLFF
ncbi:MAG: hypothetical protein Q8O32_00925 [bacterium]|nr:hypothetical protein [bacterium]